MELEGSLSSGRGTLPGEPWETGQPPVQFQSPSLPCTGSKSTHICSSKVETSLPTALLLVPAAFQPVKVAHVPWVGPQDCGPQYVAWTAHSSERVSVHVIPLLFCVPHLGTDTNLITSLLFLSDYMWIFLAALVVPGSFCQFPVHFEWELFHMKYIFDVFMGGVEFHLLLLCQLDLLFNKLWVFYGQVQRFTCLVAPKTNLVSSLAYWTCHLPICSCLLFCWSLCMKASFRFHLENSGGCKPTWPNPINLLTF